MGQSPQHLNGSRRVKLLTVNRHTPNWRHGKFELLCDMSSSKNNIFSEEFVCWITENKQPFQIVNGSAFCSLMNTGRPDCYIPSADMVSHDVKHAFISACEQIAKMLQVSQSKRNVKIM